ncbi:MAG: DUF6448 family protein [Prolixibacteraceae bacterium]|nr:DUF6448 family protein [Prolixibacteraceae bacterium]
MKTSAKIQSKENSLHQKRINIRIKFSFLSLLLFSVLFLSSKVTFAHCDTMDGPVIADAQKAIAQTNVNYVLKWVRSQDEAEIKEAFNLSMKVRVLSSEAMELSDKYFFETLVRVHRTGEGVPFTGVKPSGTPIDEKILAADKSIELGNLSPLKDLVPKDNMPELTKRFEKVMSLRNFNVNNVEAGREYIEAYVQFFHFAEGEVEGHDAHSHGSEGNTASGIHSSEAHTEASGHTSHIPWILSGFFFITAGLFGALYLKKK